MGTAWVWGLWGPSLGAGIQPWGLQKGQVCAGQHLAALALALTLCLPVSYSFPSSVCVYQGCVRSAESVYTCGCVHTCALCACVCLGAEDSDFGAMNMTLGPDVPLRNSPLHILSPFLCSPCRCGQEGKGVSARNCPSLSFVMLLPFCVAEVPHPSVPVTLTCPGTV